MSTIPSLALIPSGYKASKVYSVLPTDGSGDFDFTRSGNATRVNSDGLIETVGSNVPRLNYPLIDGVVSGCPSLLLEPERTNLVTYSEQLDNAAWTKTGVTVTANQAISPDGYQNADKVTNSTTSDFISQIIAAPTSTAYAASFYIKNEDSTTTSILVRNAASSLGGDINWNASELVSISNVTNGTLTFESVGNDWYRIFGNYTSIETVQRVRISPDSTASGKSVYMWGYQLEQSASYPTSYIPTTTTTETRSAETCNNAGDVNTFNDSEGVLFAEIQRLHDTLVQRQISITDGSSNNRISIDLNNFSNTIAAYSIVGGVFDVSMSYILPNPNDLNKVAIKYKLNDFSLYVNGFEVDTDTSGSTPSGLNEIELNRGNNTQHFYGNIKQLQYFPTALSDEELALLTSL